MDRIRESQLSVSKNRNDISIPRHSWQCRPLTTLTNASKPRQLDGSEFCLVGNVNGNLIIESRRRTQAGRSIVCPKGADKCLLGRALRRRMNPVATKIFRFVIGRSICGAGKGRWRRCLELGRGFYHERSASAPMRAESDRDRG